MSAAHRKNNSIYRPYPGTKLAFAFQVSASIDEALEATKNCSAAVLHERAAEAGHEGSAGRAAYLRYCARSNEPIDDVWRSVARDDLFPSPERPQSVADELRVTKHAMALRGVTVLRDELNEAAKVTKHKARANDRPSKSFVEGIFVGCYYSLPNGKRSPDKAARVLSDGAPASIDSGIDRHTVDYQLKLFVRKLYRAALPELTVVDGAMMYCRYHVLRWRRVEYLWSYLGARRRSPAAVAELIDSGTIFELLDTFEDSDAFTGPSEGAIAGLLRRMIAEMERARGRLQKCA